MRVVASVVIGLILLTIAGWLTAGLMWGFGGPLISIGRFFTVMWVSVLIGYGLVLAGRVLSSAVWLGIGLLLFLVMTMPPPTFLSFFPWHGDVPFGNQEAFSQFLIISAGEITAAVLLAKGHSRLRKLIEAEGWAGMLGSARRDPSAVGALFLGLLILTKALHNSYWLMIWDTTYDPIGPQVLFFPILSAFVAGVVMFAILPPRWKAAAQGFFLTTVILLLVVSWCAQSVDNRLMTLKHGEEMARAIERYNSDVGSYPDNLRQLIPRYALYIPRPIIIYGQDWCYEGGVDYYRLGYVFREHWSDPRLSGRVYRIKGNVPHSQPVCQSEIAAIQERYPEYPFTHLPEGE